MSKQVYQHPVIDLVNEAMTEHYAEHPRPHIGPSVLGHKCDRYIWLEFRWVDTSPPDPRIMRIFRRGHMEEEHIYRDLRNAGVHIVTEQAQVYLGGHLYGTADGIIQLPGEDERRLLELKTCNAKSYQKLISDGVAKANVRHWCQVQVYMHALSLDTCVYYAVCKDDDRLYVEVISADTAAAKQLIDRGHRISLDGRMPPPLSTDPTWWECKMCSYWSICHDKQLPELNCRTCAHSTSKADGEWICENNHSQIDTLSVHTQLRGCDWHVIHPDTVPWEWDQSASGETYCAYVDDDDPMGGLFYNGRRPPIDDHNTMPDAPIIPSKNLIRDHR